MTNQTGHTTRGETGKLKIAEMPEFSDDFLEDWEIISVELAKAAMADRLRVIRLLDAASTPRGSKEWEDASEALAAMRKANHAVCDRLDHMIQILDKLNKEAST